MGDEVFQVLLILAYLAIGLISVTFPIYAISVNFLPQQRWENEKERKKRIDELKVKITELTAKLGGQDSKIEAEMREQLDKLEAEKKGNELRYQYLTARGAVGFPVSALVISLFITVLGIYGFYMDRFDNVVIMVVFSIMFSSYALYRLYKTISAVQYAALKPERTIEFDVGFGEKMEKRISIEVGKSTRTKLLVETKDSDLDNLYILAYLPKELGIPSGETSSPFVAVSEYEKYFFVRKTADYLPKAMATGIEFSMTPNKIGRFAAKLRICAKGIYEYDEDLVIEVV